MVKGTSQRFHCASPSLQYNGSQHCILAVVVTADGFVATLTDRTLRSLRGEQINQPYTWLGPGFGKYIDFYRVKVTHWGGIFCLFERGLEESGGIREGVGWVSRGREGGRGCSFDRESHHHSCGEMSVELLMCSSDTDDVVFDYEMFFLTVYEIRKCKYITLYS